MKEKRIISDFDGTITDIEEETKEFQEIYPEVFLKKLLIYSPEYLYEFNKIKNELKDNETKGFILNGEDALPVSADPYILTQAASQEMIKRMGLKVGEETKFLVDLYLESISKVQGKEIHYREGKERTKKFLDCALDRYDLIFVTNSNKEKVEKYLKDLGANYFSNVAVIGNAKKLFVNPDFDKVPESFTPPNFKRDVLLRRDSYYGILDFLSRGSFSNKNTTVVGDIYELDLSLPDFLGYKVIQIENGYSKKHERDYLGKNFVKTYGELEKILD